MSYLIKLGDRGHPGGAVIQRNMKQRGLIVDSVPAAELSAYHAMVKAGVWTRHMLERFAGLVPASCTDFVVKNSAPPTWVGLDSASVQSLLTNDTGSGKGLRSYNRILHHLRSQTEVMLFNPVAIPNEEQLADIGTKQFKSATTFWRDVVGALGMHHAISDMRGRVQRAHGRSDKKRAYDEDGEDGEKANGEDISGGGGESIEREIEVNSLSRHSPLPPDEDAEDLHRGHVTFENTRLNAERDNQNRQEILGLVESGHGRLIARRFARSKDESNIITLTQTQLFDKFRILKRTKH